MAWPRRNKAVPRTGRTPAQHSGSPAWRSQTFAELRTGGAGEDPSPDSRSKAPPIRTARRILSRGSAALRSRAWNKGWGALLPLAAGRPSRPLAWSRTPASGRASLATQSRGSGGLFQPSRGQPDARPGREQEGGSRRDPSPVEHATDGEQASRHGLHCPRAPVPPSFGGQRETSCPLLTLQPQVSAPRALLEPPAATASCEPLRQALTVTGMLSQ